MCRIKWSVQCRLHEMAVTPVCLSSEQMKAYWLTVILGQVLLVWLAAGQTADPKLVSTGRSRVCRAALPMTVRPLPAHTGTFHKMCKSEQLTSRWDHKDMHQPVVALRVFLHSSPLCLAGSQADPRHLAHPDRSCSPALSIQSHQYTHADCPDYMLC